MNFEIFENVGNQNILVVGDFMIDKYIDGSVNRISPEAPIPVLSIDSVKYKLGGAGNVVMNVKSFGANVRCVACIGYDENGTMIADELKKNGVDTTYIFRTKRQKTICKTRVVSKNQQFIRIDEELIEAPPKEIFNQICAELQQIMSGIDAVIISDYGKGFVSEDIAQTFIKFARSSGIPVIVDPKGSQYQKYAGATICTPNFKELCEFARKPLKKEDEIEKNCKKMCDSLAIDCVMVTRSEKGISVFDAATGEKNDYPTFVQEVVDVTGAGDTVISIVAIAYSLGADLGYCAKIANKAASIVITKFGVATTTIDEIRFFDSLAKTDKVRSKDSLKMIAMELKKRGKKVVFTNGCFDILHAGHILTFQRAREYGDILIVGLNSDRSIKRLKGENRPIIDEKNRAKLLSSISYIDFVVIFEEDTPHNLIASIVPDVLIKGADWEGNIVGSEIVEKNGGAVMTVPLQKGLSTTKIIDKIVELYGSSDELNE